MNAWFLAGPTAVGKTAVAHELAKTMRVPILSTDSMLVYRGMDIGTAKPTPEERAGITYFGIDLVDPDTNFSTGDYLRAVSDSCDTCIATGGTGLYIKALANGLDELPAGDPEQRAILETLDLPQLQERLRGLDPDWLAALADPQNPRRLIRAIELAEVGIPRPDATLNLPKTPVIGLAMDRDALRDRIARRVEQMFEQGLIDEVRRLRERFPIWSTTAEQAIGYAEALSVLAGTCDLEEARTRTVSRTRKYAKRQRTWFNNQFDVTWVDVGMGDQPAEVAAEVQAIWASSDPKELAPIPNS